jgi:hypothetical protein
MKFLKLDHSKIAKTTNLAKYKSMPLAERSRRVWFWATPWYKLPMALPFKRNEPSQWDECDKFLKEQFPIQYVVRNLREYTPFKQFARWKYKFDMELGYKIKCFFRPRNSDLRKCIPRTWKSEDEIIQDVLETIFLRFYLPHKCEDWKNFEISDNKELNDANKKWAELAVEADNIYAWINEGRAAHQKLIDIAWEAVSLDEVEGETYLSKYGEVDKLEKIFDERNMEILNWIVKNRFMLSA